MPSQKGVAKSLTDTGSWLINAILPHSCHLCGASTRNKLCDGCAKSLQQHSGGCDVCDIPLTTNSSSTDHTCGDCQTSKPAYDSVVTAYLYDRNMAQLLNEAKQDRAIDWLNYLMPTLIERLEKHSISRPLPQCLIPVPIHWKRLLKRGFNQSDVIANELAKHFDITKDPALKKTQNTGKQQDLKRKDRLKNLQNSFQVVHNLGDIKHVALVDDVVTTGATAESLAKLLKSMGVERVDVWALARTPKAF